VSAMFAVEDLHVWFELADGGELHAVRGVALELERGERVGLVGESGCGKTTLALAMLGLLPSSASVAGRVLLDGEDLLAAGEESMRPHRWIDVAMVFQGAMNAFNPVRTVGAQIVEALELHDTATGAAARARAGELLESVGIAAAQTARFPHEFSGGMRQRAAIAMALACSPRVLIADEPTTALDVMVQAQILELLDGLCRDFGLALVLVTHDLPIVAQLCDRAAVMYAGEIVEQAEVTELFARPRHPYTRGLIGSIPIVGRPRDELAVIPGNVPNLIDLPAGCRFAPRCTSRVAEGMDRACGVHPKLRVDSPGHEVVL